MATVQDCLQLLYEETPRPEGAATTTPYQISTIARYFPIQTYQFTPDQQLLDRGDEVRGIEGAPPQLIDGYQPGGSLSMRAYVNDLIFLLGLSGFKGTFTAGGATTTDADQTTVTGVNALNSATINVGDTTPFLSAGSVFIGGAVGLVTYTGKTATSFTGCGTHPATVGGEIVNGNVPTGASKWVFTKRGGAVAKSAQLIAAYADENIWLQGQGVGVTRLSVNADGAVSADLAGLVFARLAADPNLTPAFDSFAIPNLRKGDFTLSSWLTSAGIADDFSFEIANGLDRYRGLQASYFPHDLLHSDDRVRVTGSRPARTLAAADIDALLAGTTFVAKGKWRSPKLIGATAYPYSMWVEMPACQYVGGSQDELKNARRFGGSYNWFAAWDETAGYDCRITLVGSIAAVASGSVGN